MKLKVANANMETALTYDVLKKHFGTVDLLGLREWLLTVHGRFRGSAKIDGTSHY